MNKSEIIDFLKNNVPLFQGFPETRLQELVAGSRLASYEPNESAIRFGEEGRFLGVILEGESEASITDDRGEKHRVGFLKKGDVFGEMSLMTGDKTMADVIGITSCQVLLIPSSLFSTILITHPPAVKYLSKTISERIKQFALENTGQDLAASAFRASEDPYGFKLKSDEPMKILVVNCGSSSLKYNFFDTGNEKINARGMIEKIGEEGTRHAYRSARGEISQDLPKGGHAEAFAAMMAALQEPARGVISSPDEITAVGHRVAHGGDIFTHPTIITDKVIEEIQGLSRLAPLHNPVNLVGIREALRLFPRASQVAVFDTSFHQTLPAYAYLYGLPYEYYKRNRIRRYGFHGMSHAYVALKAAEHLKRRFNELEIVTCHLGSGASICAVDHGRSIDTSMGLTPTEGLIMGTRSGNLDPSVVTHLIRTERLDPDTMDRILNRESGLKGISGISNDMREIEKAAQEGNHRALLAFKTFCYQIRKYIGAYVAAIGGLDVLVFTGGIGQGSAGVRSLACQGLGYMGIRIEEKKNQEARGAENVIDISVPEAPVRVLVIPTDEERMIARETIRTLGQRHVTRIISTQKSTPIPLEVSAHHVHLSQPHVEALFGPGHQLTVDKELSEPGQFSCKETVNLVGPKGRVERVRVLGPTRKETQVEISMTEQFKLGIHPPIRESGDIENSPGITLEGAAGTLTVNKGVICAMRHVHMSPEHALLFGLRDRDRVMVRVKGERELIFGDVLIRVTPGFNLTVHIDTDEGNAASVRTGDLGYIDAIQNRD
jgi:acetate kinase